VPDGAADDGEVEDWAVTVRGLDFGDAPDPTFPTLLASNGARHIVAPAGNPTLGTVVDTEADGQPNAGLTGDDTTASDDEDGVTFPATLIPGTNGAIELRGGTTGGTVSCWIDFTRDGDWSDAGEQVVADFALGASTITNRTFAVPVGSPQGTAATRCRISSATGLTVTGEAPDGEVEDHPAPIGVELPQIGIAKRLVSVTKDPNQLLYTVIFELRLENLGNVPLTNVNATEDFATLFPVPMTFTVTSLTSADFTVNAGFNGSGSIDLLAAGNTLAIGEDGVIRVTVQVNSAGNTGPFNNSSLARGTSPEGEVVTDISQDGTDPDPDSDGDAGDDNVPTVIRLPLTIADIPTLGEWGLLLLVGLLGLFAVRRLRQPARSRR
jgi:hypothetical protein